MPPVEHAAGGGGGPHWVRELRRHHEGTLLTGDRAVRVRFIISPACGRLVMPVERWVLEAAERQVEGALFLPEERRDALQVLLEFELQEPAGAAQDRWTAYHGDPRHRHWAQASIAGMRRESEVCEDDKLTPVNPWGAAEMRLLKMLNADRRALAAACSRLAGVEPVDACAVGVDPHGIDVRARFGIVRAEFLREDCDAERGIESPDRAAGVITRLLGDAGARP